MQKIGALRNTVFLVFHPAINRRATRQRLLKRAEKPASAGVSL
jgi:hypothetical protein